MYHTEIFNFVASHDWKLTRLTEESLNRRRHTLLEQSRISESIHDVFFFHSAHIFIRYHVLTITREFPVKKLSTIISLFTKKLSQFTKLGRRINKFLVYKWKETQKQQFTSVNKQFITTKISIVKKTPSLSRISFIFKTLSLSL